MEIGLIVALAAVIIMFSVSQREKVVEVMPQTPQQAQRGGEDDSHRRGEGP